VNESNKNISFKFFGWLLVAVLFAFLTDNYLSLYAGLQGSLSTLLIYILFTLGALYKSYVSKGSTLRQCGEEIHQLNLYLIRAFFFAVLFVGVVDMFIALLRVEQILPIFFNDVNVANLTRPSFVGTFIHFPLIIVGFFAAAYSKTIGFTWLALLIVAAELIIVICRFVFSYEQALMGDLVRYWYAALFLFSSAYTLYDEGHVRVDVVYAGLSETAKGLVNAIGSVILGLSTCVTIILVGFNGKTAILNKPVLVFEISQAGTVGMFVKYHLAYFLGIFAITMYIQFVSYFLISVADFKGHPGARKVNLNATH
jgi:TRAP-type mannitol/chloroaromatic compound transport system permease small subunit